MVSRKLEKKILDCLMNPSKAISREDDIMMNEFHNHESNRQFFEQFVEISPIPHYKKKLMKNSEGMPRFWADVDTSYNCGAVECGVDLYDNFVALILENNVEYRNSAKVAIHNFVSTLEG